MGDLIHSRGQPKRGTWAIIVIGGDTNATVLGTPLLCASESDSRGGGATGH